MKNSLLFVLLALFLPKMVHSDALQTLDADCPGRGCPSYTPETDLGCPDSFNQALAGDTLQLDGNGPGLSVSLVAGGYGNLLNCPMIRLSSDAIGGHFMTRPSLRLDLTNVESRTLVASVESDCDTVLLLDTPTASRYIDDDNNGNLDARIVLTRPQNGVLELWVGLVDPGLCNATLKIEFLDR